MKRGVLLALFLGVLGGGFCYADPIAVGHPKNGGGDSSAYAQVDRAFYKARDVIESAYKNISSVAWTILFGLAVIDLAIMSFQILTGRGDVIRDLVMQGGSRIVVFGICYSLFVFYRPFIGGIQWLAINIGLLGGNSSPDPGLGIAGPSTFYAMGVKWAAPMYEIVTNPGVAGKLELSILTVQIFSFPIPDYGKMLLAAIGYLLIVGPFVFLTLQYFSIYLRYSCVLGFGLFYLPWAMTGRTRFIAEGFLGSVVAHAVEIVLFNFVLGTGVTIAQTINQSVGSPQNGNLLMYIVTLALFSAVFSYMALKVPQMAGELSGGRVRIGGL